MRRLLLPIVFAVVACRGRDASAAPPRRAARDTTADSTRDTTRRDSTRRDPSPDSGRVTRHPMPDSGIVRGLYVNRWASQRASRLHALITIADSTEINALVIDLKDEFGLNFQSTDKGVERNAGNAGHIHQLSALLDTLHAHHIVAIARLVVFKDSVAARLNPQHVIRQPDGKPWRDKKGLTWVDPYDRLIWEYNIKVAEELGRAGFDEIQFDYIRFPEPFKSLPAQQFRDAKGVSKPKALADFLHAACPRIRATGARCTADIFGLVASLPAALEVGQQWSALAPMTDVLLPMVYPSHYPAGAFGAPHPNAAPYLVVHSALTQAHRQDARLGIENAFHVRPWLQAFTLGAPHYGPKEIEEQKRAVYDAGYDSWVLWQPGSEYEHYLPALDAKTEPRRKPFPAETTGRD
jgi:hypothetical protein